MKSVSRKTINGLIGIICMIIGAGVLIRTACFVAYDDIWFDELFTVELASKPLSGMVHLAAQDVHPPLYYIIVRLVYIICHTLFGTGIVTAAKISSIIPYIAAFAYLAVFVRRHFGLLTSGIAFLLMTTMPHMSEYMVEARMYSWAAFAVLAMFIHAAYVARTFSEISKEKVSRVFYIHTVLVLIYGTAAMYLHYYSFVSAGIIVIGLMVYAVRDHFRMKSPAKKKMIPVLALCIAVAFIAYIPWVRALLSQVGQVSENYWIQPVTIRMIPGCAKYIFKPEFENPVWSYAAAGIMIVSWIAAALHAVFGRKTLMHVWYICGSAITLFGVVLFGLAASLLLRPVFVYRYLMPVMFVFWLGVAVAIGNALENVTFDTTKCGILSVALMASIVVYIISGVRCFNLFRWEEARKSDGIKAMQDVFSDIKEEYPDTLIVCNFNQMQAIMWYYLDNDSVLWGETTETLIAKICDRYPIVMTTDEGELESIIKERGDDGFLFFGSGNARDDIIEKWNSYGFFTKMLQNSCFIERYYVNIYKVDVNF